MDKILIVEDEQGISMVLKAYLTKAGFEVNQVFDGMQAVAVFDEWHPSLVLLDVMLPGQDGWAVLKQIRARSACPVIMLTALGDVKDRLDGLRSGADDYLVKPFVGEEVVARVQAVLRRPPQLVTEQSAVFGSLRIEYASREVFLHGQPVHLTPRDLALLLFLSRHPNRSFDREQLIRSVWGIDYDGSDRAVDLAVKRIRKELADWPRQEGELMTLWGVGYKFRVQPPST